MSQYYGLCISQCPPAKENQHDGGRERESFKEMVDVIVGADKSKIHGAGWQAGDPGKR